jgi:hypothetical protein
MSKAAELAALIGSQTALSNRNLIINGAMQVAQRGTSSTSSGYATVDRFASTQNNTDEFVATYSQSTVTPDGFTTSLKVNVDTAETTLAADEFIRIKQPIEAQNLQHLQYGSSGANSLTLSFWVRSSVTGKYSVLFYAADGTRSNTQSYTINTADTWEHKTITIDGDTSGTINNDNGDGLSINWILAAGSDYAGTPHSGWGAFTATDDFAHSDMVQTFATTANATWYITGVQLEVGDTATDFEHRSYGDELQRCQRYAYKIGGSRSDTYGPGMGLYQDTNEFNFGPVFPPVTFRANPALTVYGTAPAVKINGGANTGFTATISCAANEMQFIRLTKASHGLSAAHTANMSFASTSDYIILDAEL